MHDEIVHGVVLLHLATTLFMVGVIWFVQVVHDPLMADDPQPDEPVFLGGGARPNVRFQELCELAGVEPRANVETGKPETWELKDLR